MGSQVSSAIFLFLERLHVFPRPAIAFLVALLPLIVLFEVVAKLLFMIAIPDRYRHEPTQLETVPSIDSDSLNAYTRSLEALGFTKLGDYKGIESSSDVSRLFTHAEYHCFAEVSELIGQLPMNCLIVSALEQNWRLVTTDRQKSLTSATAYAFFRQPHVLSVYESGAEPQQLLRSHLALRQQMMTDLHLQILPDLSAQAFLDLIQRDRTQQKQRLWRKSVLFGLVEMLLFSLNPKDEWLGEYADLAARRH